MEIDGNRGYKLWNCSTLSTERFVHGIRWTEVKVKQSIKRYVSGNFMKWAGSFQHAVFDDCRVSEIMVISCCQVKHENPMAHSYHSSMLPTWSPKILIRTALRPRRVPMVSPGTPAMGFSHVNGLVEGKILTGNHRCSHEDHGMIMGCSCIFSLKPINWPWSPSDHPVLPWEQTQALRGRRRPGDQLSRVQIGPPPEHLLGPVVMTPVMTCENPRKTMGKP